MTHISDDDIARLLRGWPTRLEDLTLRQLRLMCLFDAVENAQIAIEARDGEPAAVHFEGPPTVAGQVVRLDGDERTFLLDLAAVAQALQEGGAT